MGELSVSEFPVNLCFAPQNTRIKRLRLWQTCITEDVGEMVATIMVNNSYLRELELVQNHVDDPGAELIAEGIVRSLQLRKLTLCSNEIGLPGLRFLAEAVELNQKCVTQSMGLIN